MYLFLNLNKLPLSKLKLKILFLLAIDSALSLIILSVKIKSLFKFNIIHSYNNSYTKIIVESRILKELLDGNNLYFSLFFIILETEDIEILILY